MPSSRRQMAPRIGPSGSATSSAAPLARAQSTKSRTAGKASAASAVSAGTSGGQPAAAADAVFSLDPQRFPAGRQDMGLRRLLEDPLGQRRDRIDQMLAVVEQQEQTLAAKEGQDSRHRIVDADRQAQAAATTLATSAAAWREPKSTKWTAPANLSARPWPIDTASVVLPMPPGPTIVTNRTCHQLRSILAPHLIPPDHSSKITDGSPPHPSHDSSPARNAAEFTFPGNTARQSSSPARTRSRRRPRPTARRQAPCAVPPRRSAGSPRRPSGPADIASDFPACSLPPVCSFDQRQQMSNAPATSAAANPLAPAAAPRRTTKRPEAIIFRRFGLAVPRRSHAVSPAVRPIRTEALKEARDELCAIVTTSATAMAPGLSCDRRAPASEMEAQRQPEVAGGAGENCLPSPSNSEPKE